MYAKTATSIIQTHSQSSIAADRKFFKLSQFLDRVFLRPLVFVIQAVVGRLP
jgi:hypothetical protein